MFTGIITAKGLSQGRRTKGGLSLDVQFSSTPEWGSDAIKIGESIAVNGVCLTVEKHSENHLQFFLSEETLAKTHFAQNADRVVNLERALRASDRLSGHWVQGHVDGLIELKKIEQHGDAYELLFDVPKRFAKYLIVKGSVTIDGISLTINSLKDSDSSTVFSVMTIPHTWQNTNLSTARVGDHFNVELDVVAKVLERLATFQ